MDHLTPRFQDGRPMLLGGLRRHHRFLDAPTGIMQQWSEFRAMATPPGRVGELAYGVICGATADSMEYMAGVEVEALEQLPADLGRMRVPAAHYAVFTHRGHVSGLAGVWRYIWEDWMPTSGFVNAWTPDFEVYGRDFDPATGIGTIEIHVPVKPA